MEEQRRRGRAIFDQQVDRIGQLVRAVARRRGLGYDDEEELYSRVMLHVIEDDYAVLRSFERRSSWKTYLVVIIQRILLDYRVKEWGRFRPSARARSLGPAAGLLDERINRDGFSPAEAVGDVLGRGVAEDAAAVEALADAIPRRCRRRIVDGDEHLLVREDGEHADRRVEEAWREHAHARVRRGLAAALSRRTDAERELLRLRFVRGMTVRAIARRRACDARPLYRRYATILRRLRRDLGTMGMTWKDVGEIVDDCEWRLDVDLRVRRWRTASRERKALASEAVASTSGSGLRAAPCRAKRPGSRAGRGVNAPSRPGATGRRR